MNKKDYYVTVTTEFRPDEYLMMRKARAEVYNFQTGDLDWDMRNWSTGKKLELSHFSDDYEKAKNVLEEIKQQQGDWPPLDYLKNTPEYLNYVCIIGRDGAGRETIEDLWITENAAKYVFDELDEFIRLGPPLYQGLEFESLFGIVFGNNIKEFAAIKGFPHRIIRFPDTGFTLLELVDDIFNAGWFDKRTGLPKKMEPANLDLILENHIGMGFNVADNGGAWFITLEVDFSEISEAEQEAFVERFGFTPVSEYEPGVIRDGSKEWVMSYTRKKYFFNVTFLPGS